MGNSRKFQIKYYMSPSKCTLVACTTAWKVSKYGLKKTPYLEALFMQCTLLPPWLKQRVCNTFDFGICPKVFQFSLRKQQSSITAYHQIRINRVSFILELLNLPFECLCHGNFGTSMLVDFIIFRKSPHA